MITKYKFYNIKLNKIYEVVDIDFLNEQVECILPEMNDDIANWDFNVGALMQSSRLTDYHYSEYFEGDIARDVTSEEIGVVEYVEGAFVMRFAGGDSVDLSDVKDEFEIIGNQFEDRYLLEEG
ncbi:YopX family protein [Mammaliicoccus sciuri]|uniref:YopX family protein n=1 Tax=Mammaliicoccus sciuri TaxID=1296 RepID=UPI001E2C45DF|nr:YopX family protein [Mammaliicoccus sciuri]MCD8770805.1 YopX family protein [Mammaliicoccus sciuri]